MKLNSTALRAPALASALIFTSLLASPVFAHCDGMAGPVVKDAQAALGGKSADRALVTGNSYQLAAEISDALRAGVKRRFADAYAKRQRAAQSVEQGREYADSYVEFTHFVIGADHLTVEGPTHQRIEATSGK